MSRYNNNLNISLDMPEACPEDIANMKQDSCGHFCSVCRKHLTDFRGKTAEQTAAYLLTHPNTCGIYTSDQMNRPLSVPVLPADVPRLRPAIFSLATLAALLLPPQLRARPAEAPVRSEVVESKNVREAAGPNLRSVFVLEGQVLYSGGKPVPAAIVRADSTGVQVQADSQGRFSMMLKREMFQNGKVDLIASLGNSRSKSFSVSISMLDSAGRMDSIQLFLQVGHTTTKAGISVKGSRPQGNQYVVDGYVQPRILPSQAIHGSRYSFDRKTWQLKERTWAGRVLYSLNDRLIRRPYFFLKRYISLGVDAYGKRS